MPYETGLHGSPFLNDERHSPAAYHGCADLKARTLEKTRIHVGALSAQAALKAAQGSWQL